MIMTISDPIWFDRRSKYMVKQSTVVTLFTTETNSFPRLGDLPGYVPEKTSSPDIRAPGHPQTFPEFETI
jgi:hypothetical protein